MHAQTMIAADPQSDPPSDKEKEVRRLTELVAGSPGEGFVHLIMMLVDDSSSIGTAGNTDAVIDGVNSFLKRMADAPGKVLICLLFLNEETKIAFLKPSNVPRLTRDSFCPHGCTPLFSRGAVSLRKLYEAATRITARGKKVGTSHIFFTDGCNESDKPETAADVLVARTPLKELGPHIAGGFAVRSGTTDFRSIFLDMGIGSNDIEILESGKIVETMTRLGDSLSSASGSLGDFAKTMTGGIGTMTQGDLPEE